VAGAFALVAGLGDLSADGVRDWVEDAGVWAAVAFVAISAALTVAFFPGPLLSVFAAATALGAAPRGFAYTALGGSLDDLGSPEAIVAVAVLVVMAVGGVIAFRRSGSGAGSSFPASPTAGPR